MGNIIKLIGVPFDTTNDSLSEAFGCANPAFCSAPRGFSAQTAIRIDTRLSFQEATEAAITLFEGHTISPNAEKATIEIK